ncbi:hypothetical protein HDU93_002549 [Gonapodya sp. JEL0774]|nr:hypothetical protein HDU93_002549 [Gonapodya sp. JEL0774]
MISYGCVGADDKPFAIQPAHVSCPSNVLFDGFAGGADESTAIHGADDPVGVVAECGGAEESVTASFDPERLAYSRAGGDEESTIATLEDDALPEES